MTRKAANDKAMAQAGTRQRKAGAGRTSSTKTTSVVRTSGKGVRKAATPKLSNRAHDTHDTPKRRGRPPKSTVQPNLGTGTVITYDRAYLEPKDAFVSYEDSDYSLIDKLITVGFLVMFALAVYGFWSLIR